MGADSNVQGTSASAIVSKRKVISRGLFLGISVALNAASLIGHRRRCGS